MSPDLISFSTPASAVAEVGSAVATASSAACSAAVEAVCRTV